MQFSSWLKRTSKKLPRWTYPALKASWHVANELLFSVKSARRPRFGDRIEFSALEIVELRRFFLRGPGTGQVLVKTITSAMSPGTETAVLMGLPNAVRAMPFYPGYSGYGQVVATGRRTNLKKGQLVAGQIGHASIAVVDESNLVVCSSGDDPHQMAMIELGCIVQQGVRKARIRIGESILVIGAGLLGQLSVIYATLAGAGQVTVLSRSDRKRESTSDVLPAHTFLVDGQDIDSEMSVEADVVLECVGSGEALNNAAHHARRGGRVINLGSQRGAYSAAKLLTTTSSKSAELIGAHISTLPSADGNPNNMTKNEERETFADLIRTRNFVMPTHSVVTVRSSSDVNQAFESVTSGGSDATVVFEW